MTGPSLTIAVAQLNPTVGDVEGNIALVRAARAYAGLADLLVTTELVVSGYPPEDLVLRPGFINRIHRHVEQLARETADGGPAIVLGSPWRHDGEVCNAVLLLEQGRVAELRIKHELPNYGVFDEKRVFRAGPLQAAIPFKGFRLGIVICEDLWFPDASRALAADGAEILIVPNGSPYEAGKIRQRLGIARSRAAETGLPVLYVNQVGGQDELVFDGASFVVDGSGQAQIIAPAFQTAVVGTRWTREGAALKLAEAPSVALPEGDDEIYAALMLGLGDYVDKNGFPGVLLGLSGGIDSALTAALAVDALGPARVHAVMMPSRYTSAESLEDAEHCARLLGIRLDSIPIVPGVEAMDAMLVDLPGIAGENVQSRLRGMTLMALSNREGAMVVSTGNKSEMAVGYATLYGDMCGGFAVLKDVYKTQVFALSRWRNAAKPGGAMGPRGPVMPARVITKPPTAELKPNQTDQDTLPPYDLLDAVLQGLVEGQGEVSGHDPTLVERVWRMLDGAEYKRRQSPPGVKITPRSFGRERRMPITNRDRPHGDG